MKKPVIGVMPLFDDERNSVWMIPGYLEGLEAAGAVPVILPPGILQKDFEEISGAIDGYLFTGGHDVSPLLYGEEPVPECGISNSGRDNTEKMILTFCLENDVPLLGICRGIQIINVCMGGTLYQDINTQYHAPEKIEHHMSPPYDRVCHMVEIVPGTPLEKLLGKNRLGVNSYHHQAIKQLADGLEPMAVSEDGLIEAVYVKDRKYIRAVQWHPELSFKSDRDEMKIFNSFINAINKTE